MIAFTIVTADAAELRTRLLARDLLKVDGGELVGAREGVEYVEIPSPIAATRAFAVKIVRAAEANEMNGEAQDDRLQWMRTKLGKWALANSVAEDLTGPNGRVFRARRVGTKFWLLHELDAATWHVWQ